MTQHKSREIENTTPVERHYFSHQVSWGYMGDICHRLTASERLARGFAGIGNAFLGLISKDVRGNA